MGFVPRCLARRLERGAGLADDLHRSPDRDLEHPDGRPGDTWTVGTLAAGATATLTIQAKATTVAETTNTATASGKELDLDPSNDSDSVKVCVDPAPACPYCTPQKALKKES
ncbi:hypothetical protein [Acrocarpospora sp. B8E8]|uniref:DUF11 domain-containing protein n=1 Tax=Acrocarpospora sp. B8E8 TaxID=3153572 RepID=UPI00325C9459